MNYVTPFEYIVKPSSKEINIHEFIFFYILPADAVEQIF